MVRVCKGDLILERSADSFYLEFRGDNAILQVTTSISADEDQ